MTATKQINTLPKKQTMKTLSELLEKLPTNVALARKENLVGKSEYGLINYDIQLPTSCRVYEETISDTPEDAIKKYLEKREKELAEWKNNPD